MMAQQPVTQQEPECQRDDPTGDISCNRGDTGSTHVVKRQRDRERPRPNSKATGSNDGGSTRKTYRVREPVSSRDTSNRGNANSNLVVTVPGKRVRSAHRKLTARDHTPARRAVFGRRKSAHSDAGKNTVSGDREMYI